MSIIFSKQGRITEVEIEEIIDSYDDIDNWKFGETRTIVKFMRGNPHVSACVSLLENEVQNTFFAFRGDRKFPSRILSLANCVEDDARDILEIATTSYITAIIKRETRGDDFFVEEAFYGLPTPKEPWSYKKKKGKEYEDSVTFWATHALLYDAQEEYKPLSEKDKDDFLERIPFYVYVSNNQTLDASCIVKGISKAKEMLDVFFERLEEFGGSVVLRGIIYPHYNDKKISNHAFYFKNKTL